jgi:hypothetical protein
MANPYAPSSQPCPARPGVCVGPGSGSDHFHLFVDCSASKTQRWSTDAGALSPVDPRVSGRHAPVIDATGTAGSVAVQSTGRRTPPKRAVPPSAKRSGSLRGELVVASQPEGAMVFINNDYAGQTPLVVRAMDIGSRAVRLRLEGYEPWSRGVRVVANESTTVTADLTRVTPAPASRP